MAVEDCKIDFIAIPVALEKDKDIEMTLSASFEALPHKIANRTDYERFLKADLQAHGVARWTPEQRFRNPQLFQQRLLRKVEYLQAQRGLLSRLAYAIQRLRLQRYSLRTGISVPPGVFGPGLSLAHYGSIVVNSQATVGSFCRIHSATNIGVAASGAPTLGDFVYIGPGAVLYGGIHIGDGAVIGANSVVNKDVPSGVTVAGAPARLVAERGSETVMPSWFPNSQRV